MFKKMKNRKGFTLIEMMVVIAIVAVLVSVLVPTVMKAQNKSKAAVDAANLRSISATIATRYVTTTDGAELKKDLDNPDSKLVEGSHLLVYRVDNTIMSYFSSSLIATPQLRGNGYNTAVSISGDLDEDYDQLPEGAELLCALTGDGSAVGTTVMKEFADLFTQKYNEKMNQFKEAAANAAITNKWKELYADNYIQWAKDNNYQVPIQFTIPKWIPFLGGTVITEDCAYSTITTGKYSKYNTDADGDGVGVLEDIWLREAEQEGQKQANNAVNGTTDSKYSGYDNFGSISTNTDAAMKELDQDAIKNEAANNAANNNSNKVSAGAYAGEQVAGSMSNLETLLGDTTAEEALKDLEMDQTIRDAILELFKGNE